MDTTIYLALVELYLGLALPLLEHMEDTNTNILSIIPRVPTVAPGMISGTRTNPKWHTVLQLDTFLHPLDSKLHLHKHLVLQALNNQCLEVCLSQIHTLLAHNPVLFPFPLLEPINTEMGLEIRPFRLSFFD